MDLKKGDFVAVIGKVGCGKSMFLVSLLNEAHIKEGKLTVKGKVAYVEQEPFIISETVRENILMGEKFNESKYNQVLIQSQLQ